MVTKITKNGGIHRIPSDISRVEAKKRFTEATEVCEEVHERFQQDKWWTKTGQLSWFFQGKHGETLACENYGFGPSSRSLPTFLVEGWDEEKVEETWDISESDVSYWSSAELWVSILSRAAPTFIRFCWK